MWADAAYGQKLFIIRSVLLVFYIVYRGVAWIFPASYLIPGSMPLGCPYVFLKLKLLGLAVDGGLWTTNCGILPVHILFDAADPLCE
jgi:hypothetical protein